MAVILRNSTLEEAVAVAERTRAAVASSSFAHTSDRVTVSVGVATYPQTTPNPTGLLNDADQGVYKAKHAGKNQVCVFATGEERAGGMMSPRRNRKPREIRAWVTIQSGLAKNFLLEITKESDSEEVSLVEVRLEKDRLQLTRPGRPVVPGSWKLPPGLNLPFAWRAEPDPAAALVRMNDHKGIHFKEEIDIVLVLEASGSVTELRQKKFVKVTATNLEIKELVG